MLPVSLLAVWPLHCAFGGFNFKLLMEFWNQFGYKKTKNYLCCFQIHWCLAVINVPSKSYVQENLEIRFQNENTQTSHSFLPYRSIFYSQHQIKFFFVFGRAQRQFTLWLKIVNLKKFKIFTLWRALVLLILQYFFFFNKRSRNC
jgi:hypothetical protein